jgi:hypothetical protein
MRRLVRRSGNAFVLDLDATERDVLRDALGELRGLLIAESPSSDEGVARLFPPAYPDDLLQNLDFERTTGNGLLADRLAGLDEAEAALAGRPIARERLVALLTSANDLRLVYGIRLSVTEDTARTDFPNELTRSAFDVFAWLGWLVADIVETLSER